MIRVFRAPRNFHSNFKTLTGVSLDETGRESENVPEGAAVPALGLSNKAIFDKEGTVSADRIIDGAAHESYMSQQFTSIELTLAPKEEDLIQNSLWWEERKLYGHGAELQAIAVSNDRKWIASSCKANKLSQGKQTVIRKNPVFGKYTVFSKSKRPLVHIYGLGRCQLYPIFSGGDDLGCIT